MPYVLKPNKIFAKDPNGTGYLPQNVVTDKTTADMISEIEAAGASQKNAINTAGTTQTNAINSAGTTQKNAVNTAGTTQVNAVNAAGKTQTDAIDAKGEEIDQKIANADSIIDRIDAAEHLISELQSLIDLVHPVGSIYISLDSTNPGTMFGGTWEQIKGRFLLATGDCAQNTDTTFGEIQMPGQWSAPAGSTGGEEFHRLSVTEMPAHNHPPYYDGADWGIAEFRNLPGKSGIWGAGLNLDMSGLVMGAVADGTTYMALRSSTGNTGGGALHNNMPPYLGVYMWKRTA